ARWHAAPPQARIPPRAGRAHSGVARAGAGRGRDRAGLARERSVLAALDGGRLLEAKLRDRLPAAEELAPGAARQILARCAEHLSLYVGDRPFERRSRDAQRAGARVREPEGTRVREEADVQRPRRVA